MVNHKFEDIKKTYKKFGGYIFNRCFTLDEIVAKKESLIEIVRNVEKQFGRAVEEEDSLYEVYGDGSESNTEYLEYARKLLSKGLKLRKAVFPFRNEKISGNVHYNERVNSYAYGPSGVAPSIYIELNVQQLDDIDNYLTLVRFIP